jgi:hypothetical protein
MTSRWLRRCRTWWFKQHGDPWRLSEEAPKSGPSTSRNNTDSNKCDLSVLSPSNLSTPTRWTTTYRFLKSGRSSPPRQMWPSTPGQGLSRSRQGFARWERHRRDGSGDDIFCLMSCSTTACSVAMFWAICSCLTASCLIDQVLWGSLFYKTVSKKPSKARGAIC